MGLWTRNLISFVKLSAALDYDFSHWKGKEHKGWYKDFGSHLINLCRGHWNTKHSAYSLGIVLSGLSCKAFGVSHFGLLPKMCTKWIWCQNSPFRRTDEWWAIIRWTLWIFPIGKPLEGGLSGQMSCCFLYWLFFLSGFL